MIQSIDVCYRLGFRQIFCIGTEMRIAPSAAQRQLAESAGVEFVGNCPMYLDPKGSGQKLRGATLRDFVKACRDVKLIHPCDKCTRGKLEGGTECGYCNGSGEAWEILKVEREQQYAFSESKVFQAALSTDDHYYNVIQHLRLARRNLALHGLQLISITPGSRLNDHFPYMTLESAADSIKSLIGDPAKEKTTGNYTGKHKPGEEFEPTRDVQAYRWNDPATKKPLPGCAIQIEERTAERRAELLAQLQSGLDDSVSVKETM